MAYTLFTEEYLQNSEAANDKTINFFTFVVHLLMEKKKRVKKSTDLGKIFAS